MIKHCCHAMERAIKFNCDVCQDEFECPDILVAYNEKFDEYGIIIHDGTSSSITISYCPWCGKKLPDSKRGLWFDTLESMGFDDPTVQNIPTEYQSDQWYRK